MRLVLLALLLGVAPLAAAQQSEAFVRQAEDAIGAPAEAVTGARGAGLALSAAALRAATTTNVAAVSQTGADNAVELAQRGAGNRFGLAVDGSGNVVELLQQGDGNVFLGDIVGSGNVIGADAAGAPSVQVGDGNRYTLFLDGVDDRAHTVRQLGDGNQAVQTVGAGMRPASIEQRGGATVVVERR